MGKAERKALAEEGQRAIDDFRGPTISDVEDLGNQLATITERIVNDYNSEYMAINKQGGSGAQQQFRAQIIDAFTTWQKLGPLYRLRGCGRVFTRDEASLLRDYVAYCQYPESATPWTPEEEIRLEQLATDIYLHCQGMWYDAMHPKKGSPV